MVAARAVLLIEPYASGRATMSAVLAELGYDVVAAASADEARVIVASASFDAIMANTDDRAIRTLVASLAGSIPTVVLTTMLDETVPNTCVLEKPTSLDAIAAALASALRT